VGIAANFIAAMTGIVEVDETFVGGKRANKPLKVRKRTDNIGHYAGEDKTPVFGMVERDGFVSAKIIDRANAEEIYPIINESVAVGATVITDGSPIYKKVSNEMNQYHHEVINHHKDEYVREHYHTNSIEGFWSLFKRGIVGIYHHISKEHMQRYVDEFTFRYNTRQLDESERFNTYLTNMCNRLTYKQLISHE
jgi:hypothetical protein